jgi:hypothetical protein
MQRQPITHGGVLTDPVLKPGGHVVLVDLRRRAQLSFLEKEMRSAYTLPEAQEIIKVSTLRSLSPKQTVIWWGATC